MKSFILKELSNIVPNSEFLLSIFKEDLPEDTVYATITKTYNKLFLYRRFYNGNMHKEEL